MCSLILRCCFCCSWQSSLFLLSVVALVEEKERRILGKTSYLFSRLAQAFLPVVFVVFLFFFQRVGEITFRLHDDVFFSREQGVDDSGDSRRERRHDVSCVYRSSSLSSLSPSSRACTACGVFSKMVLFVGQTSSMFWCIFFTPRLFILFLAKSHASSRHQKLSSIVYHRSTTTEQKPKGFTHFSFFTFVCVEIQTHTRVLF